MNLREFFITNTLWGKILGAFFGYLSAGAVGALFGILIGNLFDKGLTQYFSSPHLLYYAEKRKEVQRVFFKTTFAVMGHISKADGRVSEREIKMAKSIMHEMRLNAEQKVQAKQFFNEGKQPNFLLEYAVRELQKVCKDNRELLKLFIDIQYKAAQVDGLTTKKIKLLDSIFTTLRFTPLHKQYRFYEDFAKTYSHHQQQKKQSYSQNNHYTTQHAPNNALAHAYLLLELEPNASKQEVKKAYRRMISKNHPDKLIAQGLPEEMIKVANDKTQKISKAYELICESKGW